MTENKRFRDRKTPLRPGSINVERTENKRFIAESSETMYDSENDHRYVYWKEIEPLLNEMDIENKMIRHKSIKKILHFLYWVESKIM